MTGWVPDVLGDEFEQLTLPLGNDTEGEVVATLVRALPERTWWERLVGDRRAMHDVDVLYVHGWSDYFFHKRLARFFTARGARFFALDLRKYGRSLRPGQSPGYVSDLNTYDEDIAAALEAMGVDLAQREQGNAQGRRLLLFGHSTGGLVLSLWAHRHPWAADAVLLNSPWLEFQLPRIGREALMPLIRLEARYRPLGEAPQIDLGFYARAQREAADEDDPMHPNPEWRPEQSMPVRAGWLKAVLEGHGRVSAGLNIPVPVVVMLSKRTVLPTQWSDDLTRADSVLVVDEVARAALRLGPMVTVIRIDGALHDIFLSRREARNKAYEWLARWADAWAAGGSRFRAEETPTDVELPAVSEAAAEPTA